MLLLDSGRPNCTEVEGVSTRHSYNTLNQAISDSVNGPGKVSVRPLFGDITTAGEWYLAIPAHSASPIVGLRLIDDLTAPDRETKRDELGVGLPTRTKYCTGKDSDKTSISHHYHFPPSVVYRLYQKAIRRSNFRIYQRYSETITTHLNRLLSMPEKRGTPAARALKISSRLSQQMKQLASPLRFLGEGEGGTRA